MVEKIHIKDREIVIPGDLLAEGMNYLPSGRAYREGEKIFASSLGLANVKGSVIRVIPLAGRYIPKKEDAVIGEIVGISKFGWRVDINCPFDADLNVGEASFSYIDTRKTPLNRIFDIGDYIFGGIQGISERRFVSITTKAREYQKLVGGVVIKVSPTKIPRIIGKAGSMIKIIQNGTGCEIIVGQNGLVWIHGKPEKEMLAVQAIKTIDQESHTRGLTDKITNMMKGGKK